MMNCQQILTMIDDYLDGYLDKNQHVEFDRHVLECKSCQRELSQAQHILDEIKSIPVPAMSPGFTQRAIKNAVQAQDRPQRRGFVMGFGSAIAAGLVLALVVGGLLPTAQVPTPSAPQVASHTPDSIVEISLSVEKVQMVNLVFDSTQAVAGAELSISLPEHVELSGYPGQQVLAWSTDLKQGRNVLSLPIKGLFNASGELVANINANGKIKAVRIQLQVDDAKIPHAVLEKYLQTLS